MIKGELPYAMVRENSSCLAFLSNEPNTLGTTVVITKDHYPSDYTKLPLRVRLELTEFTVLVMQQLTNYFPDVERCGLVWEGFGVDHPHGKVFPLHGTMTPSGLWRPVRSKPEDRKWYAEYPGYIGSHSGPVEWSQKRLANLAKKLRGQR
jgi:diadenosine tetraphosphate (Ap4A) HIT family hydrolase